MKPSPVLLAALLLVLCGCGGSDPGSGSSPSAGPTTASSSASPSASASASSSGSPSAVPTLPAGASLRQRLLPASMLPAIGDVAWKVAKSGAPEQVGACNDVGMDSIGASRTVRRDYTAAAARASNVVARLPDAMTAHRALKVLEAARNGCAAHPGPLVPVDVSGGTGWWYRTGSAATASGFGVAAVGTRFSLIAIDGASARRLSASMPGLVAAAATRIR